MTKGLYYFAHPYTCRDSDGNYVHAGEEANFRLCCVRSGELLRRGFNIYSPVIHSHPIHIATPEFLKNHEHEMWYELDNEFIARTCWNGIIMAPEWEKSTGCTHEKKMFEDMGLQVFYYQNMIDSCEVL